jgi:hypothetical protein
MYPETQLLWPHNDAALEGHHLLAALGNFCMSGEAMFRKLIALRNYRMMQIPYGWGIVAEQNNPCMRKSG